MSSFLYRLGRFAAQRRRSVLAVWLTVLVLACGGALFNEGTDDTFEIPGTKSQDALDYLARVFPETSGSSAQLVIVVPPGQDVTQIASGPTADAVEEIKKLDQVASVINPFDPNPAGRTTGGESPRIQGAVSEDHRAAILTAQLTVPLADVKQDTRDQLSAIGADLSRAIGHGTTVHVGGPAFSNPVPKLSPTEGIGLIIALLVLLLMFRSLVAAVMPLVTAVVGVGCLGGAGLPGHARRPGLLDRTDARGDDRPGGGHRLRALPAVPAPRPARRGPDDRGVDRPGHRHRGFRGALRRPDRRHRAARPVGRGHPVPDDDGVRRCVRRRRRGLRRRDARAGAPGLRREPACAPKPRPAEGKRRRLSPAAAGRPRRGSASSPAAR